MSLSIYIYIYTYDMIRRFGTTHFDSAEKTYSHMYRSVLSIMTIPDDGTMASNVIGESSCKLFLLVSSQMRMLFLMH